MKSAWLIFFLLHTVVLCAQEKKNVPSSTKIYSEDGKLQMIISYNPGCSCKTYTEFYTDGKVFAKRTFKIEGRKEFIDGEDVNYYHDGSIKDYKMWKDAIPAGRAYSNFENGKLEHEEFYTGQYKSGTWKYYNQNGSLVKEIVFEPNRTLWNSKKYDATVRVRTYSNGRLVSQDTQPSEGPAAKNANRVDLAAITDGKRLFTLRCAACHSADKDGYGPALKGVTKKRTNAWLFLMIADGTKLVQDGDPQAVALFNQWRRMKHMPETLNNAQIQAVIDYLKTMK